MKSAHDGVARWCLFAGLVVMVLAGCGQQVAPPPAPASVQVQVVEDIAPQAAPVTPVDGGRLNGESGDVSRLRDDLAAAADEDARVRAVDALAALGQAARVAYDDLVTATGDASSRVRWHAARALGLIGEDAVGAVPRLVALLDDADPIVATQAAAAIGRIRADDVVAADTPAADRQTYDAAAQALVGKLTHSDPRVRRAVLRALGRLASDPSTYLPKIQERLADADPSVVLPALHSLADIGAEAVPFLEKALADPKSRYWASVALAEIGPDAAPAVDELTKGVNAGEPEERMQSIMTLAAIGAAALPSAGEIAKALDAPEGSVRFAASYALGRLKATTADAALEKAAGDSDAFLAAIAAWARARIHPDDKSLVQIAVERLTAGLASPKPNVQTAAISALSDLGSSIDDTTESRLAEEFIRLLSSPNDDVREAAAAALVRAGAPAVEPLEKALGDRAIRGTALEILSAIGKPSQPALDAMMAALEDPDPAHRGDAAVAIATLGPDAAAAVPQLRTILQAADAPPGLRYAVAYALGRIGPAAKPAAPDLRALAAADDELMATVAVWAALKIEPQDTALFTAAVPRLRRALRDASDLARLEAAVALGDIGPAAAEAIPILELVSEEDPLPAVRAAASRALDLIRHGAAPPGNKAAAPL